MTRDSNNRILLIDDTRSIHEDFRKILGTQCAGPDFGPTDMALFDIPPRPASEFELVSAYQGREGLAFVKEAAEAGMPFAMAFVDMRMPPGWDGLETVQRLWEADPRLQVVICTAYSDHPWEEVLERLDVQDRLLIVKKPFDIIEVSQLARALTAKWSLARRADEQKKELEVLVEHLRASESALRYKSQELEGFANSVSHDLQSPLATIGSFAGLLQSELGDCSGNALHYLDRIRAGTMLGQKLVDGLLTLTHIARAELQLEPLDIAPMVRQLTLDLQDASPDRKAVVTVQPGLRVHGDARLMRIAIRNLVENAWKFSSRREATLIEIGMALETCEQSTFFVRDNGCGFDMADADQLFHNFHRLHAHHDFPGTGVGLVTVSRIMARHGGRVWADSVAGEGSTFYFSLPTHEPAPAVAPRQAQAQT
ncbi:ATP-binding protein [Caenimonas terrae]|uniref:histidine kinase n=1 Tax=Caenimonas terrae TaxID=696074 RepID=A0ABW0NN39_9BURK